MNAGEPDITRRTLSARYLTPTNRRFRTAAQFGRCHSKHPLKVVREYSLPVLPRKRSEDNIQDARYHGLATLTTKL